MSKAKVLRFWTALVGTLAVGFIWPEAWILLAFFPGQSGCFCCTAALECTGICNGGTTPSSLEVEITGVNNDTCTDCTDFDGIYVLAQVSGCGWQYTDAVPCSFIRIQASFFLAFGTAFANVQAVEDLLGNGMAWSGLLNGTGAKPVNCSTLGTNSFTPGTDTGTTCDSTSSTAEIRNV